MKIRQVYLNNKNIIKNIIVTGGTKGLAVLISLMTTPAYMHFFNNKAVLGVWLTMISILTTIAILDFGLGNGLRNQLTIAFAKQEHEKCKQLISSSYFIIVLFSVFLLIIGWNIVPYITWNRILGIQEEVVSKSQIVLCVQIVFLSIIVQIVFKLITSVLYAMQKAALVSILPVITNLIMLVFVVLVKGEKAAENLITLSKVYCFAANIPYIIVTLLLFGKTLKIFRPRITYVNLRASKSVLKLGILFFYLSLMGILVYNTNEILIAALFDSSMVVEYQIYNKIFNLISTLINILMIPLWSAVTKAKVEKNYKWMDNLHKILCKTAVAAFIGSSMIIPFMQKIVHLWLGSESIEINWMYCIPFVLYVTVGAINGANATIANGANWIKAQIIMAPCGVIINIPLTIFLKELSGNWTAIQIANVISLLPITIVQFIYIRKKFAQAEGIGISQES